MSTITFNEFELFPEHREIRTRSFAGHCYPSRYVYTIAKGRLVLSEAEELDPGAHCKPVFKKRRSR